MPHRGNSVERRIPRLRLPIRGRRIELVLPASDQIPSFVRLLNEPSVARWTLHMPYPYRERDGRDWVRRAGKGRRAGQALNLTIRRRSDEAILGGAGIHQISGDGSSAEVGYWLGKEYRGHGYAAEAVDLLARSGFRRLGIHRLEALIFPANAASRRLAQRCGFRYEGRLRDEVLKDGRWRATLLYARIASDPPPARRSTELRVATA